VKRPYNRRHPVEHDNVHRWLVSYADYMTLLFALFVVLYAMAMVNEKPFETITESIGRVFQADEDKPKNKGHGDDLLNVNSTKTNKRLYGDSIIETTGPKLLSGKQSLSDITEYKMGTNLSSLEDKLNTALYDLVESGLAQLQIDGDWLEIELNSGLLFPSGSSAATNSAKTILSVINGVIGEGSNYLRVRGYTDNQRINTEFFSSNWELSVFRATAILRALEKLNLNPARMAIEGYGEYYPNADNSTEDGRAKNRRVVIAISKYGLKDEDLITGTDPKLTVDNLEEIKQKIELPRSEIKVIKLKNGGIRITTSNETQQSIDQVKDKS
jgi:chemotaxis protein MotB